MNETLIAPPKERFSWTKVLAEMAEHSEMEAPVQYAKTIRQRISKEIKWEYPERVYKTDTKSEPGKIIIRRKKDDIQ